jgi:glycosyl transferase family 87
MAAALARVRVFWTPHRLRAARHGLWLAAIVTVLTQLTQLGVLLGLDSHAYWAAWRNALYSAAPEQQDAYLYSPAFAQGLWPLTLLPWSAFLALWSGAIAATYLWLIAAFPRAWRAPLFLFCLTDILAGNLWAFYALVVVAGLRFPAAWALPLLTKLTPGLCVIWFAARREWRSFAIAIGVTTAAVAVSFAFAPHLWADWLRLLLHPEEFRNPARVNLAPLASHVPAIVRLGLGVPAAVALTIFAARTNRPRLLPVAMFLAIPVPNFAALGLLLAIPRIPARAGEHASSRSSTSLSPAAASRRLIAATSLLMTAAFARAQVFWTPHRVRAARHGFTIAVVLAVLAQLTQLSLMFGLDSHAYWAVWRNGLYSAAPEQQDAYLYSPVFAQGLWPLTHLPWPAFFALWSGTIAAIYLWLLKAFPRAWRAPLFLLCLTDILVGNVWALFALVVLAGFRFPAVWAFPFLTKLTPGLCLLWFAARREWRALAIALGVTGAAVAVSFAFAPDLWADWLRLLLHPDQFQNPARVTVHPTVHFPVIVRLGFGIPAAIALTIFAARSNRPRLLPVAMLLATPVPSLAAFGLLLAIPRIAPTPPRPQREAAAPARSSQPARATGRTRTAPSSA